MGKAVTTWARVLSLQTDIQFKMFTLKIPTEFLLFKAAEDELE